MKKEFLMGVNNPLKRRKGKLNQSTLISPSLNSRLIEASIKKAINFYEAFFGLNSNPHSTATLTSAYLDHLKQANAFGLFQSGGVRAKDHLNFWCLAQVLSPKLYVESGVFIGSSLHSFIINPTLDQAIGIDPDLSKLKLSPSHLTNVILIDDQDFSEIEIENIPPSSLVYFDDHINTAQRIIQAKEKGFKYVLFDDSTGLEGVCQRLYPAVPTVPMIRNWHVFRANDTIEWTWSPPYKSKTSLNEKIKYYLYKMTRSRIKRVQLKFSESLLKRCEEANRLIKKCEKLPDLGLFLPPDLPERMVDTSKYLIELD